MNRFLRHLSLCLLLWPLTCVAAGDTRVTGTLPWGDLVFLDDRTLIVPYAHIVPADETERQAAREAAERWRRTPTDRIVDELVGPVPQESAPADRLNRALARLFVDFIKRHPEAARRQTEALRWVTELGLRLLRKGTDGSWHEWRRTPVWQGRARVEDRTEQIPGGKAVRVELSNLRVGVLPGPRFIVVWTRHLPGAASLFLDRARLEVVHLAPDFVPLLWLGEDELLGWRRNAAGQPMIGRYRLLPPDGLSLLSTVDGHPSPGPALVQSRPLYTGPPPLAATHIPRPPAGPHERDLLRHEQGDETPSEPPLLICAGRQLMLLDPRSGERRPVLRRSGPYYWNQCPRAYGPHLYATADGTGGVKLLRLEANDNGLRIQRAWHPPATGFWYGPVAIGNSRIWLLRDPGQRRALAGGATAGTTSRRAELWRLDLDSGHWTREPRLEEIALDAGKLLSGARLAAVSPDGAWLAIRQDSGALVLRPLAESVH